MKFLAKSLLCLGLFSCGVFFGGTREFSLLPVFFIFAFAFCASLFAGDVKANFAALMRFPIFWAGILFCAYIAVGDLNIWLKTVWKYGIADVYYKDFSIFLPSGVDAINTNYHAAATIMAMSLMWSFAICSLRLLIKHPKDCVTYCAAIAAGAVVCSFAAYLQYFDKDKFYYAWTIYDRGFAGTTFGSFFGRNNGVGYVIVGICIISALVMRNFFSSSGEKSTRWLKLVAALALMVAMLGSVLFSNSFALLFVCVFVVAALVCIAGFSVIAKHGKRTGTVFFAICTIALFVGATVPLLNKNIIGRTANEKIERFMNADSFGEGIKSTDGGRSTFYATTFNMIKSGGFYKTEADSSKKFSKIFFGSGANSYGNVSAIFLIDDPSFHYLDKYGNETNPMLTYAHCDPLQFLFEYGILWTFVFAAFLLYWIYALVRAKFWHSAFISALALPLPVMLAYSCCDIMFYNPFLSIAVFSTAFIAYRYSVFRSEYLKKERIA